MDRQQFIERYGNVAWLGDPTSFERVLEFHQAVDAQICDGLFSVEQIELRVRLIDEEVNELKSALESWLNDGPAISTLTEIADALADIDYVVQGAAIAFGLPLDELGTEVHRSNMTKLDENGDAIYREDGKVLKGPLYEPPDLLRVLYEEGILEVVEAEVIDVEATDSKG